MTMKLLLTSGGIENQSMVDALRELVGRDFTEAKLAFIPTAANVEAGDKWWLIKDLTKCKELGFKEVDVVDISAVPQRVWQPRLEHADVFVVGGGNTYHLMYWVRKSGLDTMLPGLLQTRVYVGISAGTVIATPSLVNSSAEKALLKELDETVYDEGLGFVDFMVEPHINNDYFPELTFDYVAEQSKKWSHPVYALDDSSAVKVDGDKVDVVTEGTWKKYN